VDARPSRAGRHRPVRPISPILAALLAFLLAACSGASATLTPTDAAPRTTCRDPTATAAPTDAPTATPSPSSGHDHRRRGHLDHDRGRAAEDRDPDAGRDRGTLLRWGSATASSGGRRRHAVPARGRADPEVAMYDAVDVEKVVASSPTS
jgi:hypothetical protein